MEKEIYILKVYNIRVTTDGTQQNDAVLRLSEAGREGCDGR